MLSQYSWGDFLKVVLLALVLYYAYVLLVYYREDIREWLSNWGTKPNLKPSISGFDEHENISSLYNVSHYTADEPNESSVYSSSLEQPVPVDTQQAPIPDLKGIALDQQQEPVFNMPIAVETIRPGEQSLTDILQTAKRVQKESGVVVPTDPDDAEAASLAQVINQQQAHLSILDSIPFNR